MAKIINMFSAFGGVDPYFTVDRVNEIIPALRKITKDAVTETDEILLKSGYVSKESTLYSQLEDDFDEAVYRWVEKVQKMGGLAKDMWLVDFDTGEGFLCWSYPEEKIEYFHTYKGGFKTRKKLS